MPYKYIAENGKNVGIRNTETGACFPLDYDGYMRADYDDWINDGNVPEDAYADLEEWLNGLIRPQRNAKLSETDKYMIPDYPISTTEKAKWETYRQALRDLPESLTEIVSSIPWPTVPSV
jgi:hypothetical protein